jgi:hypothetical protein
LEVYSTHSRLPGHTSRNNNNICTLQGLCEAVIGRQIALNLGGRSDVREIGSDTGGVDNIEKTELHPKIILGIRKYASSHLPR